MRILIAEDEVRLAQALKEGLEQESYAVDVTHDGEDALLATEANEYDLIILDVMMPIMNGFEVCHKIRSAGIKTPILILTAKGQEKDTIEGLDTGADDYLVKPFSFDILLARIRALLRRPTETLSQELYAEDLILNPATKEVSRGDQSIDLSSKEYAVLEYILRNKGKVLSKTNIISHVWDFDSDVLPNNLEVFIAYIRAKIDKPFKGPAIIKTVRGFGYRIEDKRT